MNLYLDIKIWLRFKLKNWGALKVNFLISDYWFDPNLTLYRAASDPTYLERGGRNQPAPQFSARVAPIGQIMIPPQTFSVNVVYKKRIGSIGQKLGPWPQFENFRNWPIWPKDRFSRISFRPYKNWHSSVIFQPIDTFFFCKCKLRPKSMWWEDSFGCSPWFKGQNFSPK